MPSYYNPYNLYPVSYANQMGYAGASAPQPVQMPQQNPSVEGIRWVQGEVGAKAFQMPVGWAPNSPIPLWDSTDTIIHLKSWGPMGVPNPLQKLRYEMENAENLPIPANGTVSGKTEEPVEAIPYATKDDIDSLRKEIREMMSQRTVSEVSASTNQNGSRIRTSSGNFRNEANRGENG